MTPNELENELAQFTGTEGYTSWSPLFRNCVLTDGAKYLAENAGAYWLMDVIASHLHKSDDSFAVARLKRRFVDWHFTLDDGDNNVLAEQVIEYSDFPFGEFKLYAVWDQGIEIWVIMLPGEY